MHAPSDDGLDRETVHAIGSTIENTRAALEALAEQLYYANTALSRARPLFVAEEKLNQLVEQALRFANKMTQEAEETALRIVSEARAEAADIVTEAKRVARSITGSSGPLAAPSDPLLQLQGTIDWLQELNADVVAELSDLRTRLGEGTRPGPPEPIGADRISSTEPGMAQPDAPWSATRTRESPLAPSRSWTSNFGHDHPGVTPAPESLQDGSYPRFNSENGR
jgi:septal ring-binding cell division protein DamX